jgi:hypothetical protein
MAKKIKLNVEDINEILVADTDSESGAEDSDFKNEFEDEQQQAAAQQDEATSGGESTNWGPPQGRNTIIHLFVGQAKGLKTVRLHTSNKDSSPLSVLMLFFT